MPLGGNGAGHRGRDGHYEWRDDVFVPVGRPVQYRSGGDIEYWGLDVTSELRATDALTVFGTTSIVSDDAFDGGRARTSP